MSLLPKSGFMNHTRRPPVANQSLPVLSSRSQASSPGSGSAMTRRRAGRRPPAQCRRCSDDGGRRGRPRPGTARACLAVLEPDCRDRRATLTLGPQRVGGCSERRTTFQPARFAPQRHGPPFGAGPLHSRAEFFGVVNRQRACHDEASGSPFSPAFRSEADLRYSASCGRRWSNSLANDPPSQTA